MNTNLVEKYRPRGLDEIAAQPEVVRQLSTYVSEPYPTAFLFSGPTGTGKTSAALAVAAGLGINLDDAEFGGLYQIASGEQDGASVRRMMGTMRLRPMLPGPLAWRVLIVNEAETMTAAAGHVWLDALEQLPPRSTVIFTTNAPQKIPGRLRDRCEGMHFSGKALEICYHVLDYIERIWVLENGKGPAPDVFQLGVIDENGDVSFRRVLQRMTPLLRPV